MSRNLFWRSRLRRSLPLAPVRQRFVSGSTLVAAFFTLAFFIPSLTSFAFASDWKPVDPAHLALKEPKVQPGADAEAIIWEVRVADELNPGGDLTTTFDQYLRVKIFTDRGREAFATVDIPYWSGMDVKDVAARTIRPDGSIVELKSADVYRRTVVKANDLKVKVVSFAVPAIEAGVIVEYRWRERYRDSIASNLRLRFSRDIPVHDVKYFLRPLKIPGMAMMAWPFNAQISAPVRQSDGSSMMSLANVPADANEEYGPPPFESRPWLFVSYGPRDQPAPEKFEREFARALHDEYGRRARPNDDIRQLSAAALASATTNAERLKALVRAARGKVRRVDVDTATGEQRRAARLNQNAADALKRGAGTSDDVVLLTLALASAAGLDARVAATSDRGDLFPRSVQPHPYFFRGRIVAVRNGDGWLFADPANEYAPNGELPWQYEDQRVLIADPKNPIQARTPLSQPGYSVKKRTGRFRLAEDGALEGDARIEYSGHWADTFREQEDQDAPAEREKSLRELVERRFAGAEMTAVRVENVTDLSGAYANVYRIRIPGYAQRTGSRLFVQPAVFQKGIAGVFQGIERKAEVYFDFPWVEEDEVRIELPAGYTVEELPAQTPVNAGSFTYDARLAVEDGQLVLRRTQVIGNEGAILFPQTSYRPIRAVFDSMHKGDSRTVVLRRKDAQ